MRVKEVVKQNLQDFLDGLWEESKGGKELVYIYPDELAQAYPQGPELVRSFLTSLEYQGCVDVSDAGHEILVQVKSKEAII